MACRGLGERLGHLNPPSSTKLEAYKGRAGENLTFPSPNSSFNQSCERWVGKQTGRKVGKVGVTATPADNGQLVGELTVTHRQPRPGVVLQSSLRFASTGQMA